MQASADGLVRLSPTPPAHKDARQVDRNLPWEAPGSRHLNLLSATYRTPSLNETSRYPTPHRLNTLSARPYVSRIEEHATDTSRKMARLDSVMLQLTSTPTDVRTLHRPGHGDLWLVLGSSG